MTNAVKRLSEQDKKVIVSYVQLKSTIKNLSKQVELMKPTLKDIFEKRKSNFVVAQNKDGDEFGIQKIERDFSIFQTKVFKEQQPDIYKQYLKKDKRVEYKAIEGNND